MQSTYKCITKKKKKMFEIEINDLLTIAATFSTAMCCGLHLMFYKGKIYGSPHNLYTALNINNLTLCFFVSLKSKYH